MGIPKRESEIRRAGIIPTRVNRDSWGIPKVADFRFDALIVRFALGEWCFGDSFRDYADGTHGGWVAVVGGKMFGCSASSPDFGFGVGFGWPVAVGGGGVEWDGPADFARLGASL